MRLTVLILGLSCLVAGCGGRQPLGPVVSADGRLSSQVQIVNASALPPPSGTDYMEQGRPYRIGPYDTLIIDVFGIEELSRREIRADGSGRISFPLAGTVDAFGKTPQELEEAIEEQLRSRYVRNPEVSVNLKEAVSQAVTVDGQVRDPGIYPVVGRMTLMRAIARASGLTDLAKADDVVIFRTVEGRRMAALYNLAAIRRGMYDDPEVYANDIVVVGDNEARRIFRDILQVAPLLTSPLVVALQ